MPSVRVWALGANSFNAPSLLPKEPDIQTSSSKRLTLSSRPFGSTRRMVSSFFGEFTAGTTISSLFAITGYVTMVTDETVHYGIKPGHFETPIIHFPTSERTSERSGGRE